MRHVFSPVQFRVQTTNKRQPAKIHERENVRTGTRIRTRASRLGLDKDISASKGRGKRKSLPKRQGPIWKTVTGISE